MMEVTRDAFLGGRVIAAQPARGYRAATDPVFLAAACPAKAGQTVLELGCGVGVASLCLAARVRGAVITGVEMQADYAALAHANAADAGAAFDVVEADVRDLPTEVRAKSFDHAMFNPPFFAEQSVVAPQEPGRAQAHVEAAPLEAFCDIALRRLRPGGTITIIQRAERLGDIVSALGDRVGDLRILPLTSRTGRTAGRVLVRATKGGRAPLRLLWPIVLHDGAAHLADGDDFSAVARGILRDMQPVDMG